MSSDLEGKIRTMIRRGHMVHLSLSALPDGKAFEASFRDASSGPTRFAEDADPVEAMKKALKAPAPAPKPAEPKKRRVVEDDLI